MVIKKVIAPVTKGSLSTIPNSIATLDSPTALNFNFSKFKLSPISLHGKFNNHYKDEQHFNSIAVSLLGTILPKITSHTYSEICEGSSEGRQIHFHPVDDTHRIILREILQAYGFTEHSINQMFEGNDIFMFSASLGHTYAARLVCHKVRNTFLPLFIDTNHHIYINNKFVRETLFFEQCPTYLTGSCPLMPSDCFAVSYLDETKYHDSFGYSYSSH